MLQGTKHCRGFWGHVPTEIFEFLEHLECYFFAILTERLHYYSCCHYNTYIQITNRQQCHTLPVFFIKRKLFVEAEIYFTF